MRCLYKVFACCLKCTSMCVCMYGCAYGVDRSMFAMSVYICKIIFFPKVYVCKNPGMLHVIPEAKPLQVFRV